MTGAEIAPSDNLLSLPATFQITGNPNVKTTSLESAKTMIISGEQKALTPIQTTAENFAGYRYDEYTDDDGGIYDFYTGTNIFCSYQRSIDYNILGQTDVNLESALETAERFLKSLNYDVTGFDLKHSNEYSRDFSVTYQYYYDAVCTSERLIIHMMADNSGQAHITSIRAYDYGRYSMDSSFLSKSIHTQTFLDKRDKMLQEKYADMQYEISSCFWKDKEDKICLRTLVQTAKGRDYIYTY